MSDAEIPTKFSDLTARLKYTSGYERGIQLHMGQRKLFLSELDALTRFLTNRLDPAIVIYPGSAPSHHTWHLRHYFPNVKYLLVDPGAETDRTLLMTGRDQGHDASTEDVVYFSVSAATSRRDLETRVRFISLNPAFPFGDVRRYVTIIITKKEALSRMRVPDTELLIAMSLLEARFFLLEEFFTMELSSGLAIGKKALAKDPHVPVMLVSDIRIAGRNAEPTNAQVIWNSYQQLIWAHIIQPDAVLFKFRTPFFSTETQAQHTQTIVSFQEIAREKNPKYYPVNYLRENFNIDIVRELEVGRFPYLDGEVILQVWAPSGSSETRLYRDFRKQPGYTFFNYDDVDFEDAMFARNITYRNNPQFRHPYEPPNFFPSSAAESQGQVVTIVTTPDYAQEGKIWDAYYQKFILSPSTINQEHVDRTTSTINQEHVDRATSTINREWVTRQVQMLDNYVHPRYRSLEQRYLENYKKVRPNIQIVSAPRVAPSLVISTTPAVAAAPVPVPVPTTAFVPPTGEMVVMPTSSTITSPTATTQPGAYSLYRRKRGRRIEHK
jgi:hypothetical protein